MSKRNEAAWGVFIGLAFCLLIGTCISQCGCAGGGRIEDSPNSDSRGMGIDTLSPKRGDVEERHATSQPVIAEEGGIAVGGSATIVPKNDQQGVGNIAFAYVGASGGLLITGLWLWSKRQDRKAESEDRQRDNELDKAEMVHHENIVRAVIAAMTTQTGPREAA